MVSSNTEKKRRGRPPKSTGGQSETRALLVRTGVELLTEKGFSSTGIEEVLQRVGVPKGSFYYYFDSKEQFGQALIASYAGYFNAKIDYFLLDEDYSPLTRFQRFTANLRESMAKYDFCRGCLIGNLGQEMSVLPGRFRQQLLDVFDAWEDRCARCFEAAQKAGEITKDKSAKELASFFWIGWEGAVLRAKLERRAAPLDVFTDQFLERIKI